MNIPQSLTDVFRDVFDDNTIVLSPETTADDILGWDSLSHATLIYTVEITHKIRFTQKEILSFNNVGELAQCLSAKLKDASII
jgi:acyl carrier protein